MAGRLANKRCLIVGGTTGIGLAAARRFLSEEARVVIAGRSPQKGAAALSELREHGRVMFVPCDAVRTSEVEALFTPAVGFLGRLDVLYPVAEISGRSPELAAFQ